MFGIVLRDCRYVRPVPENFRPAKIFSAKKPGKEIFDRKNFRNKKFQSRKILDKKKSLPEISGLKKFQARKILKMKITK